MPFTEFCCRSGGSNLNAGTRTGNSTVPGTSPSFSYASGSWVASTGVFTLASGNPQTDGVAVGDFASVYADGASTTGFVGRVTAVGSGTITVSLTAKSGTAPTDGTGNRTLRIGGAWAGPGGSSGFPMNFVTNTLTNSAGDLPRINYRNDAAYSITANINNVGADTRHQGFGTAYGDFGRAVLDGGTSGASYNLIGTTIGANAILADFECRNNGATGTSGGVFWNSTGQVIRCVFHDFRGAGLQTNNSTGVIECEAYACNQSNTAAVGGFQIAGSGADLVRCISHDNSGGNAIGFYINSMVSVFGCIADTNGAQGFRVDSGSTRFVGCDAYGNGSDGIRLNSASNLSTQIESCNFVSNGGFGVLATGGGKPSGTVIQCGFFSNTSGDTSGLAAVVIVGSVTYSGSPYVDAANGDFRISSASAKGAGRGSFTQTASSYSGTIGYPDIGAAQHQDSGGSGSAAFNPFRSRVFT